MTDQGIVVFGIPIPSSSPLFLAIVAVHVVAGLTCTVAGIIAMAAAKRAGRHPSADAVYYWSLVVVFVSRVNPSAQASADDPRDRVVRSIPFHYGWVILAAGGIGAFTTLPGQTNGVAVFFDSVAADLGLTPAQVALALHDRDGRSPST